MRAKNVALVGFLFHGICGVLSGFLGVWAGVESLVFLCTLTSGAGLIWGLLFIHLRQLHLSAVEKAEVVELKAEVRTTGGKMPGSGLFEDSTYESFSSAARLRQMERWFIPGSSLLIAFYMLAVPLLKFFLPQGVLQPDVFPVLEVSVEKALISAVGIAGIAFVLFILGKYAGGLVAAGKWRLIEAGASLSIFCAIWSLAVSLGLVMIQMGLPKVEKFLSFIIPLVMGVLGIELVLNFILHIYRAGTAGEEYRPPYASRMLRMLARPGGVFKTVAGALDYQFGFKVSQTWFYRFLERAIAPLILFQLIAFYGMTCIVVINPEETAIVERFGVPGNELYPGIHFKLPWPVEKVFKYPTQRIRSMTIGVKGEVADVILWTVGHYHHEHNFIVASSEAVPAGGDSPLVIARSVSDEAISVPVSFLSTCVEIQYRVNDLWTFLYEKAEPVQVLESIAFRELVHFLVSVDLFDIMGPGRLRASGHLKKRISEACRSEGLGIEILYAGFENVHPPVEVAGAFEEVVGAIEEKETKVLAAEAYRNRLLPIAEYERLVLAIRASAYKFSRETVAGARVEQFKKQMEADSVSSRVYHVRKFLDAIEDGLRGTRKYIVPEKISAKQVTIVDMKEKLRPGLLDIDLTDSTKR